MNDRRDGGFEGGLRRRARLVARLAPLALCALLGGCIMEILGGTPRGAARDAFSAKHSGCSASLRERRDLERGEMQVYEATGCGKDLLYACFPPHGYPTGQYDDGAEVDGLISAKCLTPDWCTPAGCDTVEIGARHKFSNDKTCPLKRVTAAPHAPVIPTIPPPPAPPADVAADPERMQMWAAQHPPMPPPDMSGHAFMTASGCGAQIVYDCTMPPNPRPFSTSDEPTPSCSPVVGAKP